ncbi:2-dehydro-3-deoxygluconokinase [Enterococcus sp. JM4C]|uniref:sugar kinase n=1 Tax=Candidatus Enterococcus huntleyi TaxID=1857217 RepID=UPI00137ACDFB|nr:sugar kinase [Enterococcus sp. JM4C]KAF1298154.1 2-dehydro-3-deoxygluconokinase [Enterococcus sp. JM4C]
MGKVLTLGEIMLRFSTNQGIRLAQSDTMAVHYGGGEANVAISLANYGHDVSFASKVPNNSLGEAVKKHLARYHVATESLLFGGDRLGTYYLESGIGQRAASVVYDRAHSSFAEMTSIEWAKEDLFDGVDIFHVSGITPALSPTWQTLTLDLMKSAKEHGCKVSFDINYRGKLWSQKEAGEVLKTLLPYVDYCSAGYMDAVHLLGIAPQEGEELPYYYKKMQALYPNIQVFYSTKRQVTSASDNHLTGTLWMDETYFESTTQAICPIVDRVGGGDAFSGGLLHGLLKKVSPQEIIEFATAASALKHTVHGDCNQFSEEEVNGFLAAGSGKIIR